MYEGGIDCQPHVVMGKKFGVSQGTRNVGAMIHTFLVFLSEIEIILIERVNELIERIVQTYYYTFSRSIAIWATYFIITT